MVATRSLDVKDVEPAPAGCGRGYSRPRGRQWPQGTSMERECAREAFPEPKSNYDDENYVIVGSLDFN